MLALSRFAGESIMIGNDIEFTVASVSNGDAVLSFTVPKGIDVRKQTLKKQYAKANGQKPQESNASLRCAPGNTVMIGNNIEVTVVDIESGKVRFGIEAHINIKVYRKELYEEIRKGKSLPSQTPSVAPAARQSSPKAEEQKQPFIFKSPGYSNGTATNAEKSEPLKAKKRKERICTDDNDDSQKHFIELGLL